MGYVFYLGGTQEREKSKEGGAGSRQSWWW